MLIKTFLLISCIIVLSFQLGNATLNPEALDPLKCTQSVPKVAVCWTDFLTHFGRPSATCCNALKEISDVCLPSIFPQNPLVAQIFKSICSGADGGSGTTPSPPSTLPFPFPFPPIGGGSGGLPFPFPFPPVGGFPFPFPFPPLGGGGGPLSPPPSTGGGASPPPPPSPPAPPALSPEA